MAIAVAQSASAGAGGGTWAATLGAGTAAGNTLFYVVTGYNTSGVTPVSSAPLLGGSSVTGAVKLKAAAGTATSRTTTDIWMLPNIPGGQTACAITVSNSLAINNVGLFAYEISGLGTTPALDQSSAAGSSAPSGTTDSGATGAITSAPEIIIGGACADQNMTVAPTGWSNTIDLAADHNSWAGTQIAASSGGTYDWSQANAGGANWSAAVATVSALAAAQPGRSLIVSQAVKRASYW